MLNDEILHKWVNGTLKAEELEEFKRRSEYDSLVELYKNTEQLAAPEVDENTMLQSILNMEKKEFPEVNKDKRHFLPSWVKYAAAAILLFSVWFFWPEGSEVVFKMAKGEKAEALLPDESTFVLNAESILKYDPSTWNLDRSLQLDGEAFFDVRKGSTFKVKTKNGTIQVLGTQFNVWSRAATLEVKCKSGKVTVLSSNGTVLDELNANDALRVVEGKATEKWQLISTEQTDWTNGISRFKKVKLEVVLDELERQFDIEITANNINTKEIISCNFQHVDLELALKTSLTPLAVSFEIRNGTVVLFTND